MPDINMGCGDQHAEPPWVNVDSWDMAGVDLVASATEPWPFDDGECNRVYLGQVIEHLDYPEGVRAALREAHRVLATGGVLCVVTPDFQRLEDARTPDWLKETLAAGLCRWPGDEHRWRPTRTVVLAEVTELFPTAHLINVTNLGNGWPPGGRGTYDCCVLATRQ